MALTENTELSKLDTQQVRELQNLLLRAGYNPGPVDGILGNKTISAYQRFLSANGHQYGSRGGPPAITKLVSDLWSNAVPELWGGIQHGGEVDATATTGGQGNPNPAPPPAPAAPAATPAATTAAGVPAGQEAWRASEFTAAPDAATEEDVRRRYPQLAYLLDNPEVRDVLLRASAGAFSEAELQGEIFKTWWWKLSSASMRTWDAMVAQDPATAQQDIDKRTVSVLNLAQQMGSPVNEEGAKWLAGRILREGWSDEQLRRFLAQTARNAGGASPGSITDSQAQLKALSRKYLSTMDDKSAQEWSFRIAEGSSNKEAVETMLRGEAKNRFTWLAEQIDAGMSPMDLFASTRDAVARQLEMDPEQIDLNDPRWSALTSPIMTDNNKQRSMNFAEAQRWARERPEWRFTNNANQQAASTSEYLLNALGVIKSGSR